MNLILGGAGGANLPNMGAGAGMGGGAGGAGGRNAGGGAIRVSPEEMEAIERLVQLGFPKHKAAEAYFACDKNEEMAANFLFEHGFEDEDDQMARAQAASAAAAGQAQAPAQNPPAQNPPAQNPPA